MKILTNSEKRVMMDNIAELQKIVLESVENPRDFIRATDLLADLAIIAGGTDGAMAIKEMIDKNFESDG